MKVDSGTVSFSCEHLKYEFLHKVLKTGKTRISIFCSNFKWFRPRSLWNPNHGNFPLAAFMQQLSTRHVKKKKEKKKRWETEGISLFGVYLRSFTLGTFA